MASIFKAEEAVSTNRLCLIDWLRGHEVLWRAFEYLCQFIYMVQVVFGWVFRAFHLPDKAIGNFQPDGKFRLGHIRFFPHGANPLDDE